MVVLSFFLLFSCFVFLQKVYNELLLPLDTKGVEEPSAF